jgi:hypothetical protein
VITSTVLTLLIVPVLYTYLHALGERAKAFWRRGTPQPQPIGSTPESTYSQTVHSSAQRFDFE